MLFTQMQQHYKIILVKSLVGLALFYIASVLFTMLSIYISNCPYNTSIMEYISNILVVIYVGFVYSILTLPLAPWIVYDWIVCN